jgi:ECF transporter S component (folate family)
MSSREFKNLRSLVITAVLIAISTVIETFTIDITAVLRINFAYLAVATIGMLTGPTMGFFAGMICDITGYFVHPGGFAFDIRYAFLTGVTGFIYGMFLYCKTYKTDIAAYKNQALYIRIIISRIIDVILINVIANTTLLMGYSMKYEQDQGILQILIARVGKNLIQLSIDFPLMFAVLPAMLLAYLKFGRRVVGNKS